MRGIVERGDMDEDTSTTRWRRRPNRLAPYALVVLLLSVAIALVGGAVVAVA